MKTDNMPMVSGAGGANPAEEAIWESERPSGGIAARFTVSSLLRGIGGMVIVSAFLMYLFQGWREGDQLTRTLILLAHTGVLTLAGFAAGHWLKESKGARLFIALALVAMPVDFAFLGGITYDQLTWDSAVSAGPFAASGQALWQQASSGALEGATALGIAAAAVVALVLACWTGFLVMARRSAWSLTGLYLLANGALLVPTRDQGAISVLLLVVAVILAAAVMRMRRRDSSLATPEGVFARGILALPLLVLGGRSIWLYAPEGLFFTSLALLGYLGLRLVLGASERRHRILELLAVVLAGISTLLAFATLDHILWVSDAWLLPLSAAILAGLLFDLSLAVRTDSSGYRVAAVLTMAVALSADLVMFDGLANALSCIVFGIAATVWAYAARLRPVFIAGIVTALLGVGFGAHGALASFTIGGWTALVLAGIAIIAAGSVIDRYGDRIRVGLSRWNRHFEPAS